MRNKRKGKTMYDWFFLSPPKYTSALASRPQTLCYGREPGLPLLFFPYCFVLPLSYIYYNKFYTTMLLQITEATSNFIAISIFWPFSLGHYPL
jgi:hypothetical protein